jgi:hypothetical protein
LGEWNRVEDEVFPPATTGWRGDGESPATNGNYDSEGWAGAGLDFDTKEDEYEGQKVDALLTWIEDILESDGLSPKEGSEEGVNDEQHHGSEQVDRAGPPESPTSPPSATQAAALIGLSISGRGMGGSEFPRQFIATAASTPTPQASPAADVAARCRQQQQQEQEQELALLAHEQYTPDATREQLSGALPGSLACGSGSGTGPGSSRRTSPLVSAFDAAAAAVSPSRVRAYGWSPPCNNLAVSLVDVAVSVEGAQSSLDLGRGGGITAVPRMSSGGLASTRPSSEWGMLTSLSSDRARRAVAVIDSLKRLDPLLTPRSSWHRKDTERDFALSLAVERSAVAEAAVQMIWGQRLRALARRVLASWLSSAARTRTEAVEEELRNLKAAAAAAAAAATAAVAEAAAAKSAAAIEAEEAAAAIEAAEAAASIEAAESAAAIEAVEAAAAIEAAESAAAIRTPVEVTSPEFAGSSLSPSAEFTESPQSKIYHRTATRATDGSAVGCTETTENASATKARVYAGARTQAPDDAVDTMSTQAPNNTTVNSTSDRTGIEVEVQEPHTPAATRCGCVIS